MGIIGLVLLRAPRVRGGMSSGAEPTSSSRARWTSRAATVLLAEILGAPRLEEMRLLRVVFLRGGVGSGASGVLHQVARVFQVSPFELACHEALELG